MLSPGDYHLRVPKDPAANLRYRLKLLRLCRERPEFQRAYVEMCRRDLLWWVNTAVFQFNPKQLESEVGPFVTWPAQDAALRRTLDRLFRDQDDILWEKSRYQGATWTVLLVQVLAARLSTANAATAPPAISLEIHTLASSRVSVVFTL